MTNPNRLSCLLVLATILGAVLWLVFSKLIVPWLIDSAYHGVSLPVLNDIISGQAIHPLEYYLTIWSHRTRPILPILLLVGLTITLINRPEFQNFVDARLGISDTKLSPLEPSLILGRQRIWLIYAVIAVIVGGSLFDIVTDTEHWPFSQYGMYSDYQQDYSTNILRLFGVTEEESPHEISLREFNYIQPFDEARLGEALIPMLSRKQLLSQALRDCLLRYEVLRHAGRHDGPPLQGIRLYQLFWKLDPWASNISRPDRKELIFEVMRSENKKS
jgi:hypothetical protein